MRRLITLSLIFISAILAGCAKSELESPCPNYGQHCNKQPINSWDYFDKRSK